MNSAISPIRRVWDRRWRAILISVILISIFIWTLALLCPERLTDDVWTVQLSGGCYLDYHTSIHAVGLACPEIDYLRLWPLPFKQPWPDPSDRPQPLPGWYATIHKCIL